MTQLSEQTDPYTRAQVQPSHEEVNAYTSNKAPRALLVGYNGANNTGSEARLLAIIEDIRAVFGEGTTITIPTLNEENLRRYIREDDTLKIKPIPTIFINAIKNLVEMSDIVILVEGSCYMDTWTSALLWAFLWATECAHAVGKPVVAYAVDAGKLSPLNEWLVRREASKTDMIITRNKSAADLLRRWGVTAPIRVTADTAFTFEADPRDYEVLRRLWPESERVVGLAPVDFYQWPVVIRLWGRPSDCYKWPYYFSRSEKRSQATSTLASIYAAEADKLIEKYGKQIAIIGMEGLDCGICDLIYNKMKHPESARIFTSLEYNASQITSILRSLDLLITSRYHAAVLSMKAGVPLAAIAHDLRLRHLFGEVGLMDSFIEYTDTQLAQKLDSVTERLVSDPESAKLIILDSHAEQRESAQVNRMLLKELAIEHRLVAPQ